MSEPILVRTRPVSTESGTPSVMRGSNCPDHPVPILRSANRNLYRAFQFQESLVRDHTPRCPILDSKRVCASCMFMCVYIDMYTCHWDPLPCATVKVPHFYLATFQGRANTHARLIYLSCSVPVFTTGFVTVICPSPPLFGLFVFFSSPWSRDVSFFARDYHSCLFSQTVFTVLLSQYSLHEPVLWTYFFSPIARVFPGVCVHLCI